MSLVVVRHQGFKALRFELEALVLPSGFLPSETSSSRTVPIHPLDRFGFRV